MVGGIVVGLLLRALSAVPGVEVMVVDGALHVVGRIFVALLQMMVVPLVLVSLVSGVASLGDPASLGRLGAKTLGLYLATTVAALVLALSLATAVSPGEGQQILDDVEFRSGEAPPLTDVLIGMVPTNPVAALADAQMLQIIVFALILGFAITVSGEAGRRIGALFEDLNAVVTRMVMLVIMTAPIGVFALVARTFATEGFGLLQSLAAYFFVVIAALLLHATLVYSALLRLFGLRPLVFFRKMRAVMTFAFSTSSSNATIPMTLQALRLRLGVPRSIASFTVPLGATINMDGTAIMQGVATVFIANVYGVDLDLADLLTVVLTATLASIGTAAVPSAGMVTLAMVLQQVGLPVEGIALIIGIDRLLDMLRTAVNVTGDCAVTCAVARSEQALDQAMYDDPDAGAWSGSVRDIEDDRRPDTFAEARRASGTSAGAQAEAAAAGGPATKPGETV